MVVMQLSSEQVSVKCWDTFFY